MKFKEIQEMSTDELLTKKRDLRQESLHLRLQQQSGQLEQPSRMRLLRRDVARVETVLTVSVSASACDFVTVVPGGRSSRVWSRTP